MAERSHLSIGEVLSLLREEFPDVTISKIRFLESQGLVDPERTPSGYRKFYDHDVERLRWILRQQREHFLPLKVIRGRLTEQEGDEPVAGPLTPEEEVTAGGATGGGPATATRVATAPPAGRDVREAPGRANGPSRPPAATPSLFAALHPSESPPAPAPVEPAAGPPRQVPAQTDPTPSSGPAPAPSGAPSQAAPGPASAQTTAPARAATDRPPPMPPEADESDSFTVEELAGACGAEATVVHELKQYGLIAPHAVVAGVAYYDAAALAVTRAAAEFARHGVEARHLRMWRNAADREADLFQQVVLPLMRQRNPQARRQAFDTLAELSSAGAALRAALVERAVRDIR